MKIIRKTFLAVIDFFRVCSYNVCGKSWFSIIIKSKGNQAFEKKGKSP